MLPMGLELASGSVSVSGNWNHAISPYLECNKFRDKHATLQNWTPPSLFYVSNQKSHTHTHRVSLWYKWRIFALAPLNIDLIFFSSTVDNYLLSYKYSIYTDRYMYIYTGRVREGGGQISGAQSDDLSSKLLKFDKGLHLVPSICPCNITCPIVLGKYLLCKL